MKKLVALACSLMLGSCVILPACTNGAVVSGWYRDTTTQELQSVLASVDDYTLLGADMTGDFRTGLELNGSITQTARQADETIVEETQYIYNIMLARTGLNIDILGAGTYDHIRNITDESEDTSQTSSTHTDIHNDFDYFYIDELYTNEYSREFRERGKANLYTNASGISLPISMPTTPTSDISVEELGESGFDVGLDTRSGIKIKISANDNYFNDMLGGTPRRALKDDRLEMYLYINEQGVLEQYSIFIDIKLEFSQLGVIYSSETEGSIVMTLSDNEVSLPDYLYDETIYPDRSVYPGDPSHPGENVVRPYPDIPYTSYDGVVTAMNYGDTISEILYDGATDSIIVIAPTVYRVYSAESGQLLTSENLQQYINCADVRNGRLCLGLGGTKQIKVVDLSELSSDILSVSIEVNDIAAMDDCIVFSDDGGQCSVMQCDYEGQHINTLISSINTPLLTPNRDDNYLYAVETSSQITYFIDMSRLGVEERITAGRCQYNYAPAKYDGRYIHISRHTYDSRSGIMVSPSELAEQYTPYSDVFNDPWETLYIGERYSFVRSESDNLLIYDREAKEFIYLAKFSPSHVYARADGTFVVTCRNDSYAAIIDLSSL